MPPLFSKRIIAVILLLAALGIGFVVFIVSKDPDTSPPAVIEKKPLGPRHEVIGLSVENRKIEAYTYGDGKTNLLFIGGIHGGYEWNSVILAYKFMDYLNANPEVIPGNLAITVIPSANPDGVYKVVGKEGRFTTADVSKNEQILASGRFNANEVDLNRNFDCDWQPKSMWRSRTVSAGSAPFSEPEALAIKNFVLKNNPKAVISWHSQSNAVYASECGKGILPETLDIMNAYAEASGYAAVKSFDSYAITGDSDGWLASIGIPAITVELKTHETIEWEENLAGAKALFEYYSPKPGL
jgi:hypothetical protein